MNKFLAIVLIAFLSLPVWAVGENAVEDELTPVVNILDEEIIEQDKNNETLYKQPISKRKIAKKFLAAMGGVAASSFALFFILTVYNRIRYGTCKPDNYVEGDMSLATPDDLNSAVKTFLDKTNWS